MPVNIDKTIYAIYNCVRFCDSAGLGNLHFVNLYQNWIRFKLKIQPVLFSTCYLMVSYTLLNNMEN